jgi:DNA-binding response OmpR family regulator
LDRPVTSAARRPAPATPPRVLVVDDQLDVVDLMGHFLEDAGFEVRTTTSCREAIELATGEARQIFDVAVIDVDTGDGDGVEVAVALRACDPHRRTRIALHSVLDESTVRARFSDYDDFLRKPADVPRLVDRIRRLADAARTLDD